MVIGEPATLRSMRMYDEEGFSDPVLIESLALDVNGACVASRMGKQVRDYRDTFTRARRFIEHARAGDVMEHRQVLSATPSLDEVVAGLAREATRDVQGLKADHERIDALLADLSSVLESAAETGRLMGTATWSLESLERVWNRVFWLAAERASVVTDQQKEHPQQAEA